MQSKPLILSLILLLSLMSGCIEDVREEQKVEKTDELRQIDDSIITKNNDTSTISGSNEIMIPEDTSEIRASNMSQEECEREGGIWIESIEERSQNVGHDTAMNVIRKMGGITDNNSMNDYDNDGSGGLNWEEFLEIRNSVEGDNLTNDSQTYRDLFASFHDLDFDSDGELSIVELLRSQDENITNERPSWCSFTNGDDFEITQEQCEERGGTWTEESERGGESYCEFDEEEREESERNMTQEDCERRGGTWTEAPDREGQYYCVFDEEEREEDDEEPNDWFFWSMNGTNEAIMGITDESLNWSHLMIDFTNSSGNYISPSQYHVADHPNYEENLTMNLSWWEDGWYTANITVYSYDEETDTSTIIQQAYWRFWLGHYCNQPDAEGCED
tara:strand:- start:1789 stop:2955 length:1167 start_codon:yes stop_codon:yes gene_type:complete